MVLNFALLLGWFLFVLLGKLDLALLLFLIQVIGAMSYRREVAG